MVSLLMVGTWTGLLLARGRFWDPPIDRLREPAATSPSPEVHAIVPARNEAGMLPHTLPALLAQTYAGTFGITLVDDRSDDGTGALAAGLAAASGAPGGRFTLVSNGRERPAGWVGKPWAMEQGIAAARRSGVRPAYWLFTDADIVHDPEIVGALVATAQAERRDLVSLMVQLRCTSGWERLLIPAFVFFFAKLYPFAWVADDRRATAAAAGGCILISDELLERIGGIARIGGALIDDCALAAAVKGAGGRLYLELTTRSHSVRPYDSLDAIWQMVARSAYTQLDESPLLLAGTVAGMLLLYILPPAAAITGIVRRDRLLTGAGIATWALLSASYVPVLRRYGQPTLAAVGLPLAALLYTLMTVDSARRHWAGVGGMWKGRAGVSPPVPKTAPALSVNGAVRQPAGDEPQGA